MKRLIAVFAVAFSMLFVAACNPDDSGATGVDGGLESPGLSSPATSPSLESMAPVESPAAS